MVWYNKIKLVKINYMMGLQYCEYGNLHNQMEEDYTHIE